MRKASAHLLRIFLTGLLAALPLAATVAVFAWAFSLLLQWLGPRSVVGGWLARLSPNGIDSQWLAYLVGVAGIALAVFVLGLLVEFGLQRGMARLLNAVVQRIPLVRSVYDLAKRFVDLLGQRDAEGTQAMRAVWCHFGGRDGAHSVVLGLQSAPEGVIVDGQRCLIVLVPTAPVPVGGGLIFVPEDWVTPADLSAEAVTSLYVSMGVTAPRYLPSASR